MDRKSLFALAGKHKICNPTVGASNPSTGSRVFLLNKAFQPVFAGLAHSLNQYMLRDMPGVSASK
jgi:hypothetical protein